MSDLDQNCCIHFNMGVMFAQMGASDPAAGRVAPVLIYEFTDENENLFATGMGMG